MSARRAYLAEEVRYDLKEDSWPLEHFNPAQMNAKQTLAIVDGWREFWALSDDEAISKFLDTVPCSTKLYLTQGENSYLSWEDIQTRLRGSTHSTKSQSLTQEKGESLEDYHDRYKEAKDVDSCSTSVESFVSGLSNERCRRAVLSCNPQSTEEALKYAANWEVNSRRQNHGQFNKKRVKPPGRKRTLPPEPLNEMNIQDVITNTGAQLPSKQKIYVWVNELRELTHELEWRRWRDDGFWTNPVQYQASKRLWH